MHGRLRRCVGALAAVAGLAVISACAGGGGSASTPTPSPTIDAVCEQPIVVACDVDEQSFIVTVSGDATDDDTLQLVRDLRAVAVVEEPTFGATVRREAGDAPVLDPEYSTPAPWELAVYPGELADAESLLADILAVEDVPGIVGIGRSSGWPYVTVTSIDSFVQNFDTVSGSRMFAEGGTYALLLLDDRLRIVHTPQWVTDAGVHEVIAIAQAYPQAEVLLEAPEGGAQPPTLYIARLTSEQLTELESRLSSDALAGFSVTGDPIAYVLSSIGAESRGGLIGQSSG